MSIGGMRVSSTTCNGSAPASLASRSDVSGQGMSGVHHRGAMPMLTVKMSQIHTLNTVNSLGFKGRVT